MNQDVHTPIFIKADASNKTNNIKQHPTYLKDCNAASRNCRVSHCSFSDITLHCQSDFASNLYNPTLAVIGCHHRSNSTHCILEIQYFQIRIENIFAILQYLSAPF